MEPEYDITEDDVLYRTNEITTINDSDDNNAIQTITEMETEAPIIHDATEGGDEQSHANEEDNSEVGVVTQVNEGEVMHNCNTCFSLFRKDEIWFNIDCDCSWHYCRERLHGTAQAMYVRNSNYKLRCPLCRNLVCDFVNLHDCQSFGIQEYLQNIFP